MTLTQEQIEAILACLDDGTYTPLERKDFAALCSMALSSIALREALEELVRLKDLKERRYESFDPEENEAADTLWQKLNREYQRCKPLAWEAARAALLTNGGNK